MILFYFIYGEYVVTSVIVPATVTNIDDGAMISRGIFLSPEFTEKNLSNDEFLNRLYRTFFNRAGDSTGYAAWVNALNTGKSRDSVIEEFSSSQEFINLLATFGL